MKIGICGKSGSGKSTVAGYYVKKGYRLIDLDVVGREVISLYPEILIEIEKSFGQEFVEGGKLDRKKMGTLVFSDHLMLERLNNIFFKYIKKETLKQMAESENIVIDGAILFEIGLDSHLDKTIYVFADKEVAVARLRSRENTDEKVLRKRIEAQGKYDIYSDRADFTVENSGSLEEVYSLLSGLGE